MVSSVFLVGSGSEIDEEVLAMPGELSRREEVNELGKNIELLCSRGCEAKDPEFYHFVDVVWPVLAQFINKETARSMNRLLRTRWDELEMVSDTEPDTDSAGEEENVMPGHEEAAHTSS